MKITTLLSIFHFCTMLPLAAQQNLLSNGDFDNVSLIKSGSVGIKKFTELDNFQVYTEQDKVYLSGLSLGEVVLFDLSGRKISSFNVNRSSAEMILPDKGFYIIRNGNRFVKVRH